MPDYKTMYLHLFQETTKAIEVLQKAQQQCEEMYVNEDRKTIIIPLEQAKE